jgi:hypothetical protein
MVSFGKLVVVAFLGSWLVACGSSDDDSVPGASSVDPSDCNAVGAKVKAVSSAVGCKTDISQQFVTNCQALQALDKCQDEWAALIKCVAPKPASSFQCDSSNEIEVKPGVCSDEQTALNTCVGG